MEEIQEHFNESLNTLLRKKHQLSRVPQKSKYLETYARVIRAKAAAKNRTIQFTDYVFLKKYDATIKDGEERLIVPLVPSLSQEPHAGKMYLYREEIFDTLRKAHIETKHGNADDVMKYLKPYKNVTLEMIYLFLKYCNVCVGDVSNQGLVGLPIKENKVCQIGLIDMHEWSDRQYKYIFVFKDLGTKFILLYPLVSRETEVVAKVVLDIFTIFGAPSELMCDDLKLAGDTIEEISELWPELKDISLKFQKLDEQLLEVREALFSWLKDKKTTKWSQGLRQLQLRMNGTNDSDLNCSPYEAMFGRKRNVDSTVSKSKVPAVSSQETVNNQNNFQTKQCNNNLIKLHSRIHRTYKGF